MYLHKTENELNSLEYLYTRHYVQIIHMLHTDWMPALDVIIDNKQTRQYSVHECRCPIKITQHIEFPWEICISVYSAKINFVFFILVLFKARIQDYVHHQQPIEFQYISVFSMDSVHHLSEDMS